MEDELKCPVCKQLYNNPVMLPCYHSLCLNCAVHIQQPAAQIQPTSEESLASNTSSESNSDNPEVDKLSILSETDSGVICNSRPNSYVGTPNTQGILFPPLHNNVVSLACAVCQKIVYFDENGPHNLPKNRAMQNIVDKYGESKNLTVKCQLCEAEPNDASVMCEQCEVFYCDPCREGCHPSRGPLAKHNLLSPLRGKAAVNAKNKGCDSKCAEHGEDTFSSYCMVCKIPLCATCTQDGRHLAHDVQAITTTSKIQKGRDMPFKKSAFSLEELCLNTIETHYDNIRHQLIRFPDTLINNIYLHSVDSDFCDRFHPDPDDFIRLGTRSLDLTYWFSYVSKNEVVDKIIRVCKNLTDLDLSCFPVPSECVIILAKHLPNLRRLNLEENSGITDLVLAEIVASNLKLEYLNIRETNVTVNGCLQLVENLPLLKKLEVDLMWSHDMWRDLFKLIKQNFIRNEMCRTYSLENVTLREWTIDDPSIVAQMFPNLRKIVFDPIREVEPWNCFNDIVAPLLCKTMGRLTSLELLRIGPVNIEQIDIFCPVLERLQLSYCSISVKTSHNSKTASNRLPFRRLRELEIHQRPYVPVTLMELTLIDEQDLRMLLLNSINLQKLTLLGCESFSESVVTDLIKLNLLQNLRNLNILWCFSLSSAIVLKLLAMKNPLNDLLISNCPSIDDAGWDTIENYIQSENLDLDLFLE